MTVPFKADITAMLARKAELNKDAVIISRTGQAKAAVDRGVLVKERQLAAARRDYDEVKKVDARIQEIDKALSAQAKKNEKEDILAKVNERNRLANAEAVRRAEVEAAERKRRAWKAKAAELSRTSTPVAE